MEQLPIISLGSFDDGDQASTEVMELFEACYRYGFFYLKDHGVNPGLVQQTITTAKSFFDLPNEVKNLYGQDVQLVHPKTSRGYIPLFGETLHHETGPDPKEVFDLGIERPLSQKPFTGPNILPDDETAPGFASSLLALQESIMLNVVPRLIRAFALALGHQPTWFDRFFVEPTLLQRVIHYPSHFSSAGKHTDNGFITVLIQEQTPTPSLRVHSEGRWIDAPYIEDCFVINIGDMLQYWTDGLFVSTPHEVQHGSQSSRISLPLFVYPNIDTVFTCPQSKKIIDVEKVMLENFDAIWVSDQGAGRARELVEDMSEELT